MGSGRRRLPHTNPGFNTGHGGCLARGHDLCLPRASALPVCQLTLALTQRPWHQTVDAAAALRAAIYSACPLHLIAPSDSKPWLYRIDPGIKTGARQPPCAQP